MIGEALCLIGSMRAQLDTELNQDLLNAIVVNNYDLITSIGFDMMIKNYEEVFSLFVS